VDHRDFTERSKMRLLSAALLTLAASSIASGQIYTISTFAGGAMPVNIPGTSASLVTRPQYAASDPAGNPYFVDQGQLSRRTACGLP
jgi:hypothetical protein